MISEIIKISKNSIESQVSTVSKISKISKNYLESQVHKQK